MDFFITSIMSQAGLNDSPNYYAIKTEVQNRLNSNGYFTIDALTAATGSSEQAIEFMFNMLEDIIRTMFHC